MYKELVKQLRSTVSRSKRTLFDDAADAIEQLQKELREERYRHDRLQDFEVAEAEQLHQMRVARSMLSKKLREKESVLSLLRQGKQQWISVEERLPKRTMPPKDVLVYHDLVCGMFIDRAWYSYEKNKWVSNLGMNLKVTHWMPLPEPPEEVNHDL